jgi:hypothetical protein
LDQLVRLIPTHNTIETTVRSIREETNEEEQGREKERKGTMEPDRMHRLEFDIEILNRCRQLLSVQFIPDSKPLDAVNVQLEQGCAIDLVLLEI